MAPISTISLIMYIVAICLMAGGVIYYILIGSKGDLNIMKAIAIIGGCVLGGMIVATLAAALQ